MAGAGALGVANRSGGGGARVCATDDEQTHTHTHRRAAPISYYRMITSLAQARASCLLPTAAAGVAFAAASDTLVVSDGSVTPAVEILRLIGSKNATWRRNIVAFCANLDLWMQQLPKKWRLFFRDQLIREMERASSTWLFLPKARIPEKRSAERTSLSL